MKYPCSILAGENACAKCISIATCNRGMIQDTGAKMIHLAKNTKSYIQSRSIANSKANATYRGLVQIYRNATNSYSEVECDSILLANDAKSDVYPTEIIDNDSSFIKHEAKTTMLDLEKSFFLATRGFDQKSIKHILVMGFVAPFTNNLPIEYAVELNRLIKAYF
jgi:Fe-S cluster assembly protein SufB